MQTWLYWHMGMVLFTFLVTSLYTYISVFKVTCSWGLGVLLNGHLVELCFTQLSIEKPKSLNHWVTTSPLLFVLLYLAKTLTGNKTKATPLLFESLENVPKFRTWHDIEGDSSPFIKISALFLFTYWPWCDHCCKISFTSSTWHM